MSATPTRRSVLRGFGLTVLGGTAGFVVARRSDAAKSTPSTAAANAYGTSTTPKDELLTALDTVPVGGGLVVETKLIVLTRDGQGDVRGYSATCTHQGCMVTSVRNGTIHCPCHGSAFNASTGAVVQGPATRPLAPVAVVVRDGNVYSA
jgi:Rieske Fe-S protein